MSRRKTGLPFLSWPSGSVVRSMVHRTGQRVGDDERRRGEIVRLHVGIDAAFEVAVAREDRRGDEVVVVDRLEIGSGSGPELPMQVVQP